jgi:hypothetical protein
MKENKFLMGEEESDKPTTATTPISSQQHTKRPTRHHVKRRSSGRVHVAKLAPMARANSSSAHTDSEADFDSVQERPVMRRSQSQRSLHKMSFDNNRKSFVGLTLANPKPTTKKAISKEVPEPVKDIPKTAGISTTSNNPASLCFSKGIAAPIEQTFNAVANTLVVPKNKVIHSKLISKHEPQHTQQEQRQLLYSQFIASSSSSYEEPSHIRAILDSHPKRDIPLNTTKNTTPPPRNPVNRTASSALPSRTQQKLNLQKQQSLVEDESSPIHPRNMQRLNKELEAVRREYKCIKRYQDPMLTSLLRCLEKLDRIDSSRKPLNHSTSTSVIPSLAAANTSPPSSIHMEQRELAHRYHHLKTVALNNSPSRNALSAISNPKECRQQSSGGLFGNAVAFIDRILSNNQGSGH